MALRKEYDELDHRVRLMGGWESLLLADVVASAALANLVFADASTVN